MYSRPWYKRGWVVAGLVLGMVTIAGLILFARQTMDYMSAIKRGENPGVGLAMRASVKGSWRANVAASTPQDFTATAALIAGLDGDPYLGPKSSADEIVVFHDYGCPYCHTNAGIPYAINRLRPDIKISIRDYPLTELHPDSLDAARAARCVWLHEPELYWAYSDALYAEQGSQDAASLRAYASRLGIDLEKFDLCLRDAKVDKLIGSSITSAESAGVRATPTYFINGKMLEGSYPLEDIINALTP